MAVERKKHRRLHGWRVLLLLVLAAVLYLLLLIVRIHLAGQRDDLAGLSPERARADVIIVLGTRQNNGRPSEMFEGRLEHAVALYRSGYAPYLLFTGGKQVGDNYTEADTGQRYAIHGGVPADAILLEPNGNSTIQSLQACTEIMRQHHLQRAILVSDPFHAFRLRRMVHDLGMKGVVSPTPSTRVRSLREQFKYIFRELPKYTAYRLFGV